MSDDKAVVQFKKQMKKDLKLKIKDMKSELKKYIQGESWDCCEDMEVRIEVLEYVVDTYLEQ